MTANLVRLYEISIPFGWLAYLVFFFIAAKLIIFGIQRTLSAQNYGVDEITAPKKSIFVLGLIACLILGISMAMRFILLPNYLFKDLNQVLDQGVFTVTVNEKTFIEKEKILSAIYDMKHSKRSGSHPTVDFSLELSGSISSITLILRRDSKRSDLYWVYVKGAEVVGQLGYVTIDGLS